MTQLINSLTSKKVTDAIDQMAPPFKNLPHLPKGVVDFLVSVSPWLAVVGGALSALSGLQLLSSGMGMRSSWWMELAGVSPTYFLVTGIIQLLSAAVLLLAFKPLQMKQKAGWVLMFWSMALSVVQMLAGVALGYGVSVVGMVLGLAIGLYLLFELRSSYH
jgi:hypothetical protein